MLNVASKFETLGIGALPQSNGFLRLSLRQLSGLDVVVEIFDRQENDAQSAKEAPGPEDADPDGEAERAEDETAEVQDSGEQQAEEEEEEVRKKQGAVVGRGKDCRVRPRCGIRWGAACHRRAAAARRGTST